GADVVQVNRLHQLGVRQIELIQATVKSYSSPLVELGTHSPIAQDGAATQPLYKPFRHLFFNSFLPTPLPPCFLLRHYYRRPHGYVSLTTRTQRVKTRELEGRPRPPYADWGTVSGCASLPLLPYEHTIESFGM